MDRADSSESNLTEVGLVGVTEAIRALAEIMRSQGLFRVDITTADVSIKLRGGAEGSIDVARGVDQSMEIVAAAIAKESASTGHLVTAPMIGTFYASAAPGQPPLVLVGDRVEAGQTIGIIEAMKIMNEIPSDRAGIVTELIAANAQAVEYGSPLLRLIPDGGDG